MNAFQHRLRSPILARLARSFRDQQTVTRRQTYHCSAKRCNENDKGSLYLHVGPSGDCWTGSSIFAAKHLQPDYVKSIPLPNEVGCVETLVEVLEENGNWAQEIYDNSTISKEVLGEVKARLEDKETDEV